MPLLILSSPELKAQVSFSDRLIVRRLSVNFSYFRLLLKKPLGQFQPNLTQSIFGWRGFMFVQMKGPTLFQAEIIAKYLKYIDEIKNLFSPEPIAQFQTNFVQSILGWTGFKFVQIKGPTLFQGEIITILPKYMHLRN